MPKPFWSDLQREALAGASLRMNGSDYHSHVFQIIAAACAKGGGHLTIFDAGTISPAMREKIAQAAPGQVTFEYQAQDSG